MSPLKKAIVHINASLSVDRHVDEATMLGCLKGDVTAPKWQHHVLSFFHETDIPLMHDIVLFGVITFPDLYKAHLKWDQIGYANGETTEWIKEMAYLTMGKAAELGLARFV